MNTHTLNQPKLAEPWSHWDLFISCVKSTTFADPDCYLTKVQIFTLLDQCDSAFVACFKKESLLRPVISNQGLRN